MSKREFPYNKINFILSVIGFIGSMAFYYGVLKDLNNKDDHKQQIEQLKKENKQLKKRLGIH